MTDGDTVRYYILNIGNLTFSLLLGAFYMIKKWFCITVALVMSFTFLCGAEVNLTVDAAVTLEGTEDNPIIEDLPPMIDIGTTENLDLSLSDIDDGQGTLDVPQPAPGEAGEDAVVGAITIENDGDDGDESEPRLALSADKLVIGVKEKCTILEATRVPGDDGDTVTWSSDKCSGAGGQRAL